MDDTLEFLTKIYSELTEFRKETKEDIKGLKKDVLRIEQEHGKKLEALFDGYKQNDKKLERIDERLHSVEGKVDSLTLVLNSQDKRLEVVEFPKKRKAK